MSDFEKEEKLKTGLETEFPGIVSNAVVQRKNRVWCDADSGKLVATVPIGEGPDGVAFDPASGLAFSANGEGTLTVVHEDSPEKFSVVATVTTRRGARTIALDEATHRIYLPTAEFGAPTSPTAERPHPRPNIVPGSFVVLVVQR